ncbi:hypothetical protein LP419_05865 [Massilia sp. H-1]|nr:hypothetical protein LP419_05865 [Massilia sp. H-1]
MANRTYLLGLNQNFFETDDVELNVILEAKYAIPPLWLTLFTADDIRLYHDIPLAVTSWAQALANIDRRTPAMIRMLGEAAAPLLAQWRQVIEKNEFANYLLNPSELKDMEDEAGQFHEEFKGWFADLAAIELGGVKPSELGLMLQHGPTFAEMEHVINPNLLCGGSANITLPWEK